jgi:hypothetical protein
LTVEDLIARLSEFRGDLTVAVTADVIAGRRETIIKLLEDAKPKNAKCWCGASDGIHTPACLRIQTFMEDPLMDVVMEIRRYPVKVERGRVEVIIEAHNEP